MKRRIISVLATVALACGFVLANPGTAQAAPHHHNTLPYPTGCGANAVVISRHHFAGGTASVVYSRNCGTNWIEWYGPAIETGKGISAGTNWALPEWDYTRWAYSRQVSAPGSTPIDGWIWAGNQGWDVHCEWTCTWTRYA